MRSISLSVTWPIIPKSNPTEVGVQNLMYLIYNEVKAGRTPHPERLYPELAGTNGEN